MCAGKYTKKSLERKSHELSGSTLFYLGSRSWCNHSDRLSDSWEERKKLSIGKSLHSHISRPSAEHRWQSLEPESLAKQEFEPESRQRGKKHCELGQQPPPFPPLLTSEQPICSLVNGCLVLDKHLEALDSQEEWAFVSVGIPNVSLDRHEEQSGQIS